MDKESSIMESHRFAPELNKKSLMIDKERHNQLFSNDDYDTVEPINRYELLYEYHKYLLEKKQK